jgi:SAM-dependent methyltransferase
MKQPPVDPLAALRDLEPSNPKRRPVSESASWYGYYAGYADKFVADIVAALPQAAKTVLDPWNGSGTTTAVATAASLGSKGFDINPAAVTIAKARLLRSDVAGSIASLTDEIIDSAVKHPEPAESSDFLLTWFSVASAGHVRSLERRIHKLLVETEGTSRAITAVDDLSALAALFYLGLFRTVRTLLSPFLGSNPTWVRRNIQSRNRLRPNCDTIHQVFQHTMGELAGLAKASAHSYSEGNCPYSIGVASSTTLPLDDHSVDAVITSPPYCTRIDYVIATLPELAVLGLHASELKKLRDSMIGTPTIPAKDLSAEFLTGCKKGEELLERITGHDSKASGGYYRKFFLGYLRGMDESLAEIRRVSRPGAPVVFVVQDSYYKEIRVDLAGVIREMAEAHGLSAVADHNFEITARRNYATINPRSRAYRDSTPAIESVLILAGD